MERAAVAVGFVALIWAGCASVPERPQRANDPANADAPAAMSSEPDIAAILAPEASALAALPQPPVQEQAVPSAHGGHHGHTESVPEKKEPVRDYRTRENEADAAAGPRDDSAPGPGADVDEPEAGGKKEKDPKRQRLPPPKKENGEDGSHRGHHGGHR